MAETKIAEYLNKILEAVYGKDVRQSIHDAIQQCYTDATAGITPVITTEAVETGTKVIVTVGVNSTSFVVHNGTATAEEVETYVNAWLDEHPEATTTVADGSITKEKLADDVVLGVPDGGVTSEKLSGITKTENDVLEYENAYIDYDTGEIKTTTSDLHVTKAYPVIAGNKIYFFGYIYNYNKYCNGAYYDATGAFVSSFRNGTQNHYYDTVPENASYVRFTVNATHKEKFHFGNPLHERMKITYEDVELNQVLASMIANLLPEKSVDFSALNLFKQVRYNKIDDTKKSELVYTSSNNGLNVCNGSYHCDIETGKSYKTAQDLTKGNGFLVFFDVDGEEIAKTSDGSDVFKSYSTETINYSNYYTFEIPDNVAEVIYVHSVTAIGSTVTPIIAEADEYNVDTDRNTVTWVCTSEEFAEAMQSISNVEKTYSDLEGKTWIALGDSYTHGLSGNFETLAEKYGLIADNRGVVSSSVCGDTAGTKGFSPMWNRAKSIAQEYTEAGTADDVKLITFMGGANDGFGKEAWIGEGINDADTNHIYGAMNVILNTLRATFKNAEIVVILQPSNYSRKVSSITDDETAQTLGFSSLAQLQNFDDYQFSNYAMVVKERAVEEMARAYNCHIVDCCFDWYSVLNSSHRSTYWAGDALHLSSAGNKALTKKLEAKLDEIFG